MNAIVEIGLFQFALIYLLLILVGCIMRLCSIPKTKQLIVSSLRMTVQLVLAGFVLTYIFENPHPVFPLVYLAAMILFTIRRVLSRNPGLNRRFQWRVGLCIAASGLSVLAFFLYAVVGESILNPQYAIPIAGMLMGNTMTGVSLGLKAFLESLTGQRTRLNALLCAGASPKKILLPFVRQALETAILPTLNSMVGMGIVSLPGMMTGQILSGTLPMTAILYQIAIMIAICTVVCLACFGSLYFGYQTLYDEKEKIIQF